MESLGGVGAMTLAIPGLASVLPFYLASIAAIAAGTALLAEGSAVTAQFSDLRSSATHGRVDLAELGGGMTTEMLGGLAGVTLGVLALVGVDPASLLATATLVFGGTLLVGSGLTARLNDALLLQWGDDESQRDPHQPASKFTYIFL